MSLLINIANECLTDRDIRLYKQNLRRKESHINIKQKKLSHVIRQILYCDDKNIIVEQKFNEGYKFFQQLTNIFGCINFLVYLELNYKSKLIKITTSCNRDQNIIFTSSNSLKIQLLKYFGKLNSKNNVLNPQIMLTVDNIIKFQMIFLINGLFDSNINQNKFTNFMKTKIVQNLNFVKMHIHKICVLLNLLPKQCMNNSPNFMKKINNDILSKIKKHLFLSIEEKNIEKILEQYEYGEQIKEDLIIGEEKQHIPKKYTLDQSTHLFDLFCLWKNKNQLFEKKLTISQLINSKLSLLKPSPKFSFQLGQNIFIFNTIYIENIDKIKTKVYREDQNQTLIYLKLKFIYIPTCNAQPLHLIKNQNYLQKHFFVKKYNSMKEKNGKSHELKILMQFRSLVSAYFFKYYISNQQNFIYCKDLLMDAFKMDSDLQQYLTQGRSYISLRTKLYFIAQIAQALSTLEDMKVVHLNTNPQSIIILKNLQVKILDFTQSYCQSVCKQDFLLKLNFEYSAPQLFTPGFSQYKYCQDVYSLGIIMYKMLLDGSPYRITTSVMKSIQKSKYLSKIYYIPEVGDLIQYNQIFTILSALIFQCISQIPQKRTNFPWIIIIIKQIMNFTLRP